jgi:hypothetical protein
MAHAESREGKLTGRWAARVRTAKAKFPARFFDTKAAAELYETLTKATGVEPPQFCSEVPEGAKTFAQVAKECKDAGGPRRKGGARKWKAGRDPSVIQRVTTLAKHTWFGVKPVVAIDEKVLEELREKLAVLPGYHGGNLSAATLNRFMDAASAVLTFAWQEKMIPTKPQAPKYDEDNEKIVWLTEDQERVICNAMFDKNWTLERLAVRVLIETGSAGVGLRAWSLGRSRTTVCACGRPRPIVHDLHAFRPKPRIPCARWTLPVGTRSRSAATSSTETLHAALDVTTRFSRT